MSLKERFEEGTELSEEETSRKETAIAFIGKSIGKISNKEEDGFHLDLPKKLKVDFDATLKSLLESAKVVNRVNGNESILVSNQVYFPKLEVKSEPSSVFTKKTSCFKDSQFFANPQPSIFAGFPIKGPNDSGKAFRPAKNVFL